MLDSRENTGSRLYQAARRYRAQGWSVLPVRGAADPQNPKVAAVPWAALQRSGASPETLQDWFGKGLAGGVGLVCGRVSRLAVLDLDDADAVAAFAQSCPQLLDTFTVRSGGRGQPHYYFEVPDAVSLRGMRAPGADLQFEGAYVVAPPTSVGGQRWQVMHEAAVLRLDQGGADALMQFVALWRLRCDGGPVAALAREWEENEAPPLSLTEVALQGWYRKLARRGGRNQALFKAASLARDSGWSEAQGGAALMMLHVAQPPAGLHVAETMRQREAEAWRTIRSAWCRPRRVLPPAREALVGLPNALREEMLVLGEVAALRVLEGLALARVRAGRLVSERGLCELLGEFGIGRRSVQRALRSRLVRGQRIFNSPRNPPRRAANAAVAQGQQQKKCFSVSGAERVKKGRPARLYRVPTLTGLLKRLKLKDGGSDPLLARDLRSPRAYRCALHRALIERRPGRYSRRWLGARLGVSIWTSRRYDRRAGLSVQARYQTQLLDEQTLAQLPERRAVADGRFLVSEDGRRWPALQGLARRLLRRCRRLWYLCQGWNHYEVAWVESSPPVLTQASSAAFTPRAPWGGSVTGWRPSPPAPLPQGEGRKASESVTGVTVGTQARTCERKHKSDEVDSSRARVVEAGAPVGEGAEEASYWHCAQCERGRFAVTAPAACSACGSDGLEAVPPQIWRDAERCRAWWRERRGSALGESGAKSQFEALELAPVPEPDARELTLTLELCEATRSRGAQGALAYETARQLLREHGAAALRRALHLLQRRRDIRNPAGFVVSLIRGGRGAAHEQRLSQEEWLAALRASPWADFIEV